MAHTVEIVGEPEELTDDSIVITLRCCGNPNTDFKHTLHNVHAMEEADIDAEIEERKTHVEKIHTGKLRVRAYLDSKIKK